MIQFENDKIKEIYHGSDKIKEIFYYGSELVWRSPNSYMILTDGTRIDFELENTPIANFCTYDTSVTINGVSYNIDTIKEVYFGDSYSGVTEIGSVFMRNFTSLTDVGLNLPALNSVGSFFLVDCRSLTNVTLYFPVLESMSGGFLQGCRSLTNVTLDFPALSSVGSNFLTGCSSLTDVTLTAETPPIAISTYFLDGTQKLSSIYVPANSVNLYKTTYPWNGKSSLIKEVYYGFELVWSTFKPSYAILTDGRRIDFEVESTPITNFCNTGTNTYINGRSYNGSTIKEVHFGTSYSGVTEIGNGFLKIYYSSVTDVTLNLPALNSVGGDFLEGCTSLTNLTLDCPALNSVGGFFLYVCSSLTNLTLTAETPPSAPFGYFMQSTPILGSIYVPANSVNLYKTTSPWSSKSSRFKAI